MVRLKAEWLANLINYETGFNSNVVRLKDNISMKAPKGLKSFNSNVVRLKASPFDNIPIVVNGFQFQCGTIKRPFY